MQSPVGGDILTFTILGFYKTRCDEWGLGLIEKLRTMQACVVSYKVAMAEGFIISKTGMFILKVHFNPSNSCWHASVLSWHCHIQEQNKKKGGGLREPLLDSGNQFVKKKKKKKLSVSIQNGNVSYQLVVLIDIVLLQRIKFAATEQEKPRSYKTHKSTSLLQSSVLKQRRLTCVMQSCIADSLLHTSQQQRDTCLIDPTLKIWN